MLPLATINQEIICPIIINCVYEELATEQNKRERTEKTKEKKKKIHKATHSKGAEHV